jgi:hypothetical protein
MSMQRLSRSRLRKAKSLDRIDAEQEIRMCPFGHALCESSVGCLVSVAYDRIPAKSRADQIEPPPEVNETSDMRTGISREYWVHYPSVRQPEHAA